MRNLNKETKDRLSNLYERLDGQSQDIETLINRYNYTVCDLNEMLQEIGESIREYIDDRSEKWHESERAEQYEDWCCFFDDETDELDDLIFDHGAFEDVPLGVE